METGRMPVLRTCSLPIGFVEEDSGGGADVEGVDVWWHGNRHGFIAGGEHCGGNAVTFAAEDNAAISAEIGLRQNPFVRVRVRGDTVDAARAKVLQAFDQG